MTDHTRAFDEGFIHGYEQMAHSDRVLAFGAIRRAAAYARAMDRAAVEEHEGDHDQFIDMAHGARSAIRAAIGSEKT